MSKEVFHHVPVCIIEDFQRVPGGTAEALHPFPGGTEWTIFWGFLWWRCGFRFTVSVSKL